MKEALNMSKPIAAKANQNGIHSHTVQHNSYRYAEELRQSNAQRWAPTLFESVWKLEVHSVAWPLYTYIATMTIKFMA